MEDITDLIQKGYNDQLEERLKENPALANIKTDQGISLLQFAAYCRNDVAVRVLKKYKQDIDIFEATSLGDSEAVDFLLDKNPESLHSFSADGFTVLGLASYFGHFDLVKRLLEQGANPNVSSNNSLKVAPIHSACAISNYEIVELLIFSGADINAKQMKGVTPLHSTAHNGETRLCTLLIEHGADVNARMDNGATPLSMAVERGFQDTAALLIRSGGY